MVDNFEPKFSITTKFYYSYPFTKRHIIMGPQIYLNQLKRKVFVVITKCKKWVNWGVGSNYLGCNISFIFSYSVEDKDKTHDLNLGANGSHITCIHECMYFRHRRSNNCLNCGPRCLDCSLLMGVGLLGRLRWSPLDQIKQFIF